jgi:hypothetical protein
LLHFSVKITTLDLPVILDGHLYRHYIKAAAINTSKRGEVLSIWEPRYQIGIAFRRMLGAD